MELTDDMRDGFVQSLVVESADRTRFAARSATRTGGNVTVFENGVYTACEPCRENPEKPPLWQVKAARIIHDQGAKTIHYEKAQIEFFGRPVAYLPYFSQPDPTVKRKTGFLPAHIMSSTEYGFGVKMPFFWNIAPNMDVTLSPAFLSNQGILGDIEFRHRLANGSYSIRAAGIVQDDPEAFPYLEQQREARGALQTKGHFDINDRWAFGWDVNLLSDRWVLDDYDLWGADWSEAISTAYLTGQGDRSYFDLRGYHFYGLSQDDDQEQLPIVGVWDYDYVVDKPILGGELSFNVNLTSTYREETDFEPLTRENAILPDGTTGLAASGRALRSNNLTCGVFETDCLGRGIGGNYTRGSVEAKWRKEVIDPLGQVWTPFAFARGDFIWVDPEDSENLAALINTDSSTLSRGMVGAGVEYRYPFVAHNSFGTHILEPIAQIIVRPDEGHIGKLPNEDAQSLFFDTTTLFAWDKFSGYDRIEGGGRANVGAQYTLNMASGGFLNVMAGQSYHLFGTNSFAETDLTSLEDNSGLETSRSDYVASAYLQLTKELAFSTRFRFNEDNLYANAIELEARFNKGPISGALLYGRYEDQPRLGFDNAGEGILGNLRVNLTDTVYVAGAARYNIDTEKFDKTEAGIGYMDECFSFGVNYAVDFSENGNEDPVQKIFLTFALRTLGSGGTSFDVSGIGASDDIN
ncbi:LPS-assembly protein LptD [Terrihabitans sp. B22-R8]|uniref:LPS-assembly protein LptD n=1 Tax=Terrihabitans sp. B22-R8 TaxID=3425128 RepID=UPI00403D0E58